MLRHFSRHKIKFLRYFVRERLRYIHLIRVSRTIKTLLIVVPGGSVILLILFILIQLRPTQSTFERKLIYQAPLVDASLTDISLVDSKNPLTPKTRGKNTSQNAGQQITSSSAEALFDYDGQTFVRLSPATGTLTLSKGRKEHTLTNLSVLSNVQALRVHEESLIFLKIRPVITSSLAPSKLSLTFLDTTDLSEPNFIPIQTQFILSRNQENPESTFDWLPSLAETTLHSYEDSGMLLRVSKDIVISIQTNGVAKWLPIPSLLEPFLVAGAVHLETVLSMEKDELYFVLLTKITGSSKSHQLSILRYHLTTKDILSQHKVLLDEFNYFNISKNDRLITTSFDTNSHVMIFKSQPFKKIHFFKGLFSQDAADKTLLKKLHFADYGYPQGLRFKDVRLIGFYETSEGTDYWKWE